MKYLKKIIISIFLFFEYVSNKFFNRSIKYFFLKEIDKKNYKKITLNQRSIFFYTPTSMCNFRVNTFFEKEPETLEWINQFDAEENNDICLWDIGANIGLYSIYAAVKHKNLKIFSFEPSTSNLRVLSRNLSINNLNDNITIVPIALGENNTYFSKFYESSFEEGGALNSFKYNKNYIGDTINYSNSYNILGLSLDELLEKTNMIVPRYIKIDVDGLEHFILRGSVNLLKSKELKEIFIEINENYEEQFKSVIDLMTNNNFIIVSKKNSELIKKSKEFSNTFNYHFKRIIKI